MFRLNLSSTVGSISSYTDLYVNHDSIGCSILISYYDKRFVAFDGTETAIENSPLLFKYENFRVTVSLIKFIGYFYKTRLCYEHCDPTGT